MIRRPLIAAALLIAATAIAEDEAKRSPLAFDTPQTARAPGFDGKRTRTRGRDEAGNERDERYARGLFEKYDRNGDRVLQKEEWRRIRGTPEKADTDGDGRITFDELRKRVSLRRQEREAESSRKGKERADSRKSYRLLTPHERLPEGLPDWFYDRDADGDGQVAMHEYSGRWNDSTVRRFAKIDTDGDGLITPAEAQTGRR